jgi:hypothetical protein
MATKTSTQLKAFFETGDQPTADEFVHVFDSHLNLTDGGTVAGATTFTGTVTGVEAVIYAATGVITSGATFNSGAMTVPANSIITDMGMVVTAQLAANAGIWGHRFGTTANAVDLAALDDDGIEASSATVAVGIGASMDAAVTAALGGTAVVVMDVGDAYRATATAVHGSILSDGGSITGGEVTFWVKYINIA